MIRNPVIQILENFPHPLHFIYDNDPVIYAAPYLTISDIEAVIIINKNNNVKGVLTGYNIISLINKHVHDVWSILYKTRASDVTWDALMVTFNEELFSLLKKLHERKIGYSIVLENAKPVGIIGLVDIIKFYVYSGVTRMLKDIKARDLLSRPLIKISPDKSLREAISIMINMKVRRIFVEGFNLMLNDRSIIRKLLTFPLIERLRDEPDKILNAPIQSLTPLLQKPDIVGQDDPFDKVAQSILKSEAHCLVTSGFDGIITPWDVIMKSFILSNKYYF